MQTLGMQEGRFKFHKVSLTEKGWEKLFLVFLYHCIIYKYPEWYTAILLFVSGIICSWVTIC